MKKVAFIFILLFLHSLAKAQLSFRTVVPQQAVIKGESFQVQYVVEDGDKSITVNPPVFANFRLVTGPYIYPGIVPGSNGLTSSRNVVYTLEAMKTGRFIVAGATITVNGKIIRSNDATIEVISKEEALKRSAKENAANTSVYFLQSGEDPYQKIKENLFVTVAVDKKSCYVGEPVLATYKLYSRLESRSDIEKNPGFYGFTIYDMVNLSDKQVTTEYINGKAFDVHTIRKVQLYPLQTGNFTIDAMQIKNKVEFSKSTDKKGVYFDEGNRRHILTEGTLNQEDDNLPLRPGAAFYESEINTEPVTIKVKPIPEKNKPASFAGATGHFTISSAVVNNKLKKNEEDFFEITVSGKGNFIQLSAPPVQWPAGMEGFEPVVKDTFDKTKMPLTGSRTFRYPFTCATPGEWQLPSVSVSFFDIDSNSFKTISAKPIPIHVSNEEKAKLVEEHKESIAETSERAARTAGIIVGSVVLIILLYWIFKKKEPEKIIPVEVPAPVIPSAEELLQPAYAAIPEGNSIFYSVLYTITWKFAAEKFNLSGSDMNKQSLVAAMKGKLKQDDLSDAMQVLLEKCEIGKFTQASVADDKNELLVQVAELFSKINSDLLQQT